MFNISTLPTGTAIFFFLIATPRSEPAAMTWYSGASSQKYFKLLKAPLHSWISSKIISVFPDTIGALVKSDKSFSIRFTSFVFSNISASSGVLSKLNSAIYSKHCFPNSRMTQVLPVCLDPLRMSGFLFSLFIQRFKTSMISRLIFI